MYHGCTRAVTSARQELKISRLINLCAISQPATATISLQSLRRNARDMSASFVAHSGCSENHGAAADFAAAPRLPLADGNGVASSRQHGRVALLMTCELAVNCSVNATVPLAWPQCE